MLIIVVCLFALCWMPLQLYRALSAVEPSINGYTYINIIWFCSNLLAMSNSCFNPFIYGLLNEKFKQEFRRIFAKCLCSFSKCTPKEIGAELSEDSASGNRKGSSSEEQRVFLGKSRRTARVSGYASNNSTCATTVNNTAGGTDQSFV